MPDAVPKADPELAALQSLELRKEPGRLARGRRGRRVWWLGFAVVLIGGYVAFDLATAVPTVRTARVLRQSPVADREITTANGYIVARTRASVASKMQGRLSRVLVDEGDLVEAGQLLAEVEHTEQDAAVAEAQAQLENASSLVPARTAALREAEAAELAAKAVLAERRAAVAEAKAVVQERDASFSRTEKLFAKSIAGEAELDQAREARDVARAREQLAGTTLATAESLVRRAAAGVEVARQTLERSQYEISAADAVLQRARATREHAFIRAPFAGMVLRREAEPGEVVSPANTGASGSKTAVITLADFATLEVEVDVYERDIARIETRTPCRIVLDAFADRPLRGQVRLLRPTADRTRATVQVYVSFVEVPAFARPEMGARVVFYQLDTDVLAADELTVPSAALTERDGRQGVFVLAGTQVRFRAVELAAGAPDGERRVARSGVSAGELVVLDPASDLRDSVEVVAEDR